jgi:hypothetical protein
MQTFHAMDVADAMHGATGQIRIGALAKLAQLVAVAYFLNCTPLMVERA